MKTAVGVLGRGLVDAFEGAIQRGDSFSDVLKGLALDFARLAAQRGGDALLDGGGEAGPEAILPLARRSDGKLGVKAAMTRAGGDAPQGVYRLAA